MFFLVIDKSERTEFDMRHRLKHMAFSIFLCLILFGMAACSSDSTPSEPPPPESSFSQWTALNSGTSRHLWGVHMINADLAVAVGDSSTILVTIDGGDHWQQIDWELAEALYSVSFFGMNGFAVGQDGLMFHSTDGGLNWWRANSGTNHFLFSVEIMSSSFGVAVGGDGTILRTSTPEESDSWEALPWNEVIRENMLADVAFADANVGVVVGINNTDVFRTTNGGDTWAHITGPFGSEAVDFADSMNGIIVSYFGGIFLTDDSGVTWEYVIPEGGSHHRAVSMPTADSVAIAASGWVLRSDNGGHEWTKQTPPNGFTDIHMLSADTGMAVGNNGVIYRTRP
ncbi:MAG: hypothetical protein GY780_18650 [bacterium]|nr:hypothetical protein [bacterium]